MDLYIYYRVALTDTAEFLPAATAMQSGLAIDHGIACALKRRPESPEGLTTWMEVYLHVPENFTSHLAQALANSGVMTWTAGVRHTEFFISESFATGSSCA